MALNLTIAILDNILYQAFQHPAKVFAKQFIL